MASSQWSVRTSIDKKKCRVCADATGFIQLTPEQAYIALCAPETASIFRVERRTPVAGTGAPGDPLVEEVHIAAPLRVLFWKKWARTRMRQTAHLGDSQRAVAVQFELVQSDLISKLEGSWEFTLERPGGDGQWPLTRVAYKFCMWPKGVPTALRRLPGLMDAVSAAVARESVQMMDKLVFIQNKMAHPAMDIMAAARAAAAEVAAAGSYKKLHKRKSASGGARGAAAAASAAARGAARGSASGGKGSAGGAARPQVVVVAHRLSFESSLGSVESLTLNGITLDDDYGGAAGAEAAGEASPSGALETAWSGPARAEGADGGRSGGGRDQSERGGGGAGGAGLAAKRAAADALGAPIAVLA